MLIIIFKNGKSVSFQKSKSFGDCQSGTIMCFVWRFRLASHALLPLQESVLLQCGLPKSQFQNTQTCLRIGPSLSSASQVKAIWDWQFRLASACWNRQLLNHLQRKVKDRWESVRYQVGWENETEEDGEIGRYCYGEALPDQTQRMALLSADRKDLPRLSQPLHPDGIRLQWVGLVTVQNLRDHFLVHRQVLLPPNCGSYERTPQQVRYRASGYQALEHSPGREQPH